jgi:DNA-binding PadR family transcriptional regulator
MHTSEDIQSYLPLTEVTYFILLSLASAQKHGYAIMKDVEAMSHKRVSLSTGTLYGALKRLLEHGFILRSDEGEANHTGRTRKDYRLTELGYRVLQAEVRRLDNLVTAAQLRSINQGV